jgi:nucleoside-diphosphate-sugar epimerase
MGVSIRKGDVTDKESLRGPMAGADGVFHLAGWYEIGRKHREMCRRVNVDGTRNVLEVMEELHVPRGVYTSTLAIYGDTRGRTVDETTRPTGPWTSDYDRTKCEAHVEVAEPMMRRGLPLVCVLPGVVYGPGDTSQLGDVIRQYLRGKLRAVPKTAAHSWGHVEDIAHAHLLAMDRGRVGESYIVAGEPHTFVKVLETAEKITGIPAPRMHPSRGFLLALAAITGSQFLRVAPATYLGSNAKAKRELGLVHRPLEQGLRETLLHEMAALGISRGG